MSRQSRPSRARGLKLVCGERFEAQEPSRPSRARGLKHPQHSVALRKEQGSRPSRARGLKQAAGYQSAPALDVAPLTGAWIETSCNTQS